MNNNEKLTARQEKFVELIIQGETLKSAYLKSFPKSEKSKIDRVYHKASETFNLPHVHKRYMEIREMLENEFRERAIWTRERAINELKDLLLKNKRESERYEQAYEDEMEMLDRQIIEKTKELENPKGYMSKKLKASLMNDLDNLKMARITCNRRHQSNRNVNEAILNSIAQLNEMLGYNKKDSGKLEVQAQVSFIDDIPDSDEK